MFLRGMTKETPSKVSVGNDFGGQIVQYVLRMRKMRERGTQISFAGSCRSACTLYLGLPAKQVCIQEGAAFTFHKPYNVPERNRERAAQFMLKSYPAWVRKWIARNGGLSDSEITMRYDYARKFMSTCSRDT